MRTLCVLVGVVAMFALSAGAQQKNNDEARDSAKAAEPVATAASTSADAAGGTSQRRVTNLLAAPAPRTPYPHTPFPAANNSEEAPGRLVPRFEGSGGFSYVNFHPGSPFESFDSFGASGSFTYNPSRWLGLTAELAGYNFDRRVNGTKLYGSWTTFLFGSRLNMRKFNYFVPFAEFLLGGAAVGADFVGAQDQKAFSIAAGGGVDVILNKNVAWRFAQIDYLMTNFSGPNLGGNARQDNLRLGSSIVIRWGFPAPPPPPAPKVPPSASCSATPASVYAGSNDAVTVRVNASSPDNLPLTYSYTATGGTVEGTGPEARWTPGDAAPGNYSVSAKVDDGKGGTASCSADIRVEERPHHPPTISCSANPTTVTPGQQSKISCPASSPDNLPLTFNYSASAGKVTGTGPEAQFDSTGLQPGSYTIQAEVTDSRGDKAQGSTNVDVKQPPPAPEQVRLEQRLALHSIYFPTAQPSAANPSGGLTASQAATLDALATDFKQYLTYKPEAHLILEGHADIRGSKEYNEALSERRVARVKSYLMEKGIAADHVETKAFGFEKNMTDADVRAQVQSDPELSAAEKQRILRNLLTVRLANNRRVDITLTTTGEQSVRRFPFNSRDALTLLSRGGATGTKKAPAAGAKKPAPKKTNP